MPPFFAVTFKKPSLLELLPDEAGKCGPIRKAVLLLQQLLYKGSRRDLVLCQTGATGSFLHNAVCSWNKFKWLLAWGHLTVWATSFALTMHHSNATGLITGHQRFLWGFSPEEDGYPDSSTASSACPLVCSPEHLSLLLQMWFLLRLWSPFPRNLITLCWKPVSLVNLSSG